MTDKQAYQHYVARRAARSPVLRNCAAAFLVGGSICLCGQLLRRLYSLWGAPPDTASMLVSLTFVLLAALATGLGVFDSMARYAGAGPLLPITGFANAVVSPALEFKTEGYILGTGAKMFILACPVIVYGITASVTYGVFYWVTTII